MAAYISIAVAICTSIGMFYLAITSRRTNAKCAAWEVTHGFQDDAIGVFQDARERINWWIGEHLVEASHYIGQDADAPQQRPLDSDGIRSASTELRKMISEFESVFQNALIQKIVRTIRQLSEWEKLGDVSRQRGFFERTVREYASPTIRVEYELRKLRAGISGEAIRRATTLAKVVVSYDEDSNPVLMKDDAKAAFNTAYKKYLPYEEDLEKAHEAAIDSLLATIDRDARDTKKRLADAGVPVDLFRV